MFSDGSKRSHAPGAEQLGDTDLAGSAPVLAVGCEGDVGVVVGEFFDGLEDRTAGEDEIVGFEDGFECVAGGDDEGGDGSEAEEH